LAAAAEVAAVLRTKGFLVVLFWISGITGEKEIKFLIGKENF
jgi:hypothetical protein